MPMQLQVQRRAMSHLSNERRQFDLLEEKLESHKECSSSCTVNTSMMMSHSRAFIRFQSSTMQQIGQKRTELEGLLFVILLLAARSNRMEKFAEKLMVERRTL